MRSLAASVPAAVSTVAWTVIPLNNFAMSGLPVMTGGRVGVGSVGGVAFISAGAKR